MKGYVEHQDKAVAAGGKFEHVMAISLDPRSGYKEGVLRCIKSREGDVMTSGYVDKSVLHKVHGDSLEHFSIGEELAIRNQDEVIKQLTRPGLELLGLEDPDIWIDEITGLIHLYFTMPFHDPRPEDNGLVHLGHAVGKDLDSLEMTMPVLMGHVHGAAKELSVAPVNKQEFRYNLIESSRKENDFTYSIVRTAIAHDMGQAMGIWRNRFSSQRAQHSMDRRTRFAGAIVLKEFH